MVSSVSMGKRYSERINLKNDCETPKVGVAPEISNPYIKYLFFVDTVATAKTTTTKEDTEKKQPESYLFRVHKRFFVRGHGGHGAHGHM